MIDKLSLTIYRQPNFQYLENNGEIKEDRYRQNMYKYLCQLDHIVVLYEPHKFSDVRNDMIPFTKVDLNPKHFESFDHMLAHLLVIFKYEEDDRIPLVQFNITRLDVAVDLEDFNTKHILSSLHVKNIRDENMNFYKGTIYAGSDPKIRIYNKNNEIKRRQKKGWDITPYENGLLESGKDHTRFEVQKRNTGLKLAYLIEAAEGLASYFDRLEFFDLKVDCSCTVMHVLYKQINRKFRKELEKFKDMQIVPELKKKYIASIREWFISKEPF